MSFSKLDELDAVLFHWLYYSHLNRTGRAEVRLQDILKTLTSADVDLQSLPSPL